MAGKKPVVLVDIDDTLASQHDAVIRFLTEELHFVHTGPSGPVEDHWNPATWFNASPEEIKEVFGEYGHRILANAPIVAGAKDALSALAADYTVIGCTGRRLTYVETTKNWVSDNLPGLVSDIEFVAQPDGTHVPKTSIVDKYDALTLVDDLPFFLVDFVAEKKHAVYLNHGYQWQVEMDCDTIDVAESWSDAVSIINRLSRPY